MRDTLRASADKLRMQAIIVTTAATLFASTLPAVSYYYVFQMDDSLLGPFAWAHWAICGAACALGILAHGLGNKVLLALHTALCCMMGAALGGFETAFWYTLQNRCQATQLSFTGCSGCPCAATNSCTANLLADDPLCDSCTAYPKEACSAVLTQHNKYILAFTGLATVVFLALSAFYSLLALCRLEASGAAAVAKHQMVSFAVDQQTTLVESGDKPTVTPAMLATWVNFLLDSEDPDCAAIGNKCRTALAQRGFELPVNPSKKGKGRPGSSKGKSGKDGMQEVAVDASAPPAEAYVAAEAGHGHRKSKKSSQVAAEERRIQFMAGA